MPPSALVAALRAFVIIREERPFRKDEGVASPLDRDESERTRLRHEEAVIEIQSRL